jgi:hypothetical protein
MHLSCVRYYFAAFYPYVSHFTLFYDHLRADVLVLCRNDRPLICKHDMVELVVESTVRAGNTE